MAPEKMPDLERLMLHRLAELDPLVRQAYADFDYKRIFAVLSAFMTVDLSAFYFDIRKTRLTAILLRRSTREACLDRTDDLFRAHRRLAGADARSLPRKPGSRASPQRSRSTLSLSRRCRPSGATTRWRRNGASCATFAAWSRARSSSNAPPSASAPRSKPRPLSMSAMRICLPRRSTPILPNCASPRRDSG